MKIELFFKVSYSEDRIQTCYKLDCAPQRRENNLGIRDGVPTRRRIGGGEGLGGLKGDNNTDSKVMIVNIINV